MQDFLNETYRFVTRTSKKLDRKTIAEGIQRVLELYEKMIPNEPGYSFVSELSEMCGKNYDTNSFQYLDWLITRSDTREALLESLLQLMNMHIAGKTIPLPLIRKVVQLIVVIGYKRHINVFAFYVNDYKFDKTCDY